MASLAVADIRRKLMHFRYDPVYHGEDNRVPIVSLANMVGISRQSLYKVMGDEQRRMSKVYRDRLTYVIRLIDAGMRFRRRNRMWEPVMPDGSNPPGFEVMKGEASHGVAHLYLS